MHGYLLKQKKTTEYTEEYGRKGDHGRRGKGRARARARARRRETTGDTEKHESEKEKGKWEQKMGHSLIVYHSPFIV
ncbi:MAG: hypothetical protein D6679_13030 [Candidatus Hydrogenedentota bacterium]|nr:MAG: hypothetical protein D6679_13030 [Candidatus Hydrogenedentota bacterium]